MVKPFIFVLHWASAGWRRTGPHHEFKPGSRYEDAQALYNFDTGTESTYLQGGTKKDTDSRISSPVSVLYQPAVLTMARA